MEILNKKQNNINFKIKQNPEDFIVKEIPLYNPMNIGNHAYFFLKKNSYSTPDLIEIIKKELKIKDTEIGCAGLKDKKAITYQYISINLESIRDNELKSPDKIKEKIELVDSKKINLRFIGMHNNKLRVGHLLGNLFLITIRDIENLDKNLDTIKKNILEINKIGMPNFYGEQRFGIEKDNIEKAKKIVNKEIYIKNKWLKKFLLSSYQSHLFNKYLEKRIEKGFFNKLLVGDICKKHSSGGIFEVLEENKKIEQKRFENKEISFTGPIYGKGIKQSKLITESRIFETEVLNEGGLNSDELNRILNGTRRIARVFPEIDIKEINKKDKIIVLSFFLPKGSYATVVLDQIFN